MGRRHRPGAVRRPDFRLEHVPRYREAVPAVRLTAAHVRLDPAASCLLPFAFCLCPALPPAGVRTGRVLSGVAVLFLAFDAAMKLLQVPMAVEGTIQLGYPASSLLVIGLIQVVCLAVYLVPRTAILGAVLWTGYLGGAIATHLRVGN